MQNNSPLKSWVRKHSPKRNKPLPAPPNNAAAHETAKPLGPISGNVSPSKQTSKLRSFLRPKPQPPSASSGPPSPPRHSQHRDGRGRSVPPPAVLGEGQSSIRKSLRPRQRSADLRGLSQKISSLEAQLQEARKELDSVSQHAPTSLYATENYKRADIRSDHGRRRSFADREKYEHLVEKLLDQREREKGLRGLSCKSTAELGITYKENRAVEDTLDDGDDDIQFSDTDMQRHKRKRSAVRQASWEKVQSHLQMQQQLQQQAPEPKRLRHSRGRSLGTTSPRSKDLPEVPEFPSPPNRGDRSDFIIQGFPEEEVENNCPPLNRHQGSFSQQPSTSTSSAPARAKRHERRQSQIIDPEQLREAFGQAFEGDANKWKGNDRRKTLTDIPEDSDTSWRRMNASSPNRRKLSTASRLDKVDEEFEWDEDIF